jgi:hypothetical protein
MAKPPQTGGEMGALYLVWHWFHSVLYANEHYFWTLGL